MDQALTQQKGIFCGSFLGPNDTMAGASYNKDAFWPEVSIFEEKELRAIFEGYTILRWTEHKVTDGVSLGKPHSWHIFSVVAKKS